MPAAHNSDASFLFLVPTSRRLTPGPIPLVFALVVVYYAIVPPSKPRYFGVLGLDFSDKAFTFVVAGMVREI